MKDVVGSMEIAVVEVVGHVPAQALELLPLDDDRMEPGEGEQQFLILGSLLGLEPKVLELLLVHVAI